MAKRNGAARTSPLVISKPRPPENTPERDGKHRTTVERESHGAPSHATRRQKTLVFAFDAPTHTRTPPTTAKRAEWAKIEPSGKRGTRRKRQTAQSEHGTPTRGAPTPSTTGTHYARRDLLRSSTANARQGQTHRAEAPPTLRAYPPSLSAALRNFRTYALPFFFIFGFILYFLLFFAYFLFLTKIRPNLALFTKPPRSPRAPRPKTAVFVHFAQSYYTK